VHVEPLLAFDAGDVQTFDHLAGIPANYPDDTSRDGALAGPGRFAEAGGAARAGAGHRGG
jgi:hypothetical protein